MANELHSIATSGLTLYAVLRNSAGQPWNVALAAFEAYNAANYANYAIAMIEQGASGYYTGSFPSGRAAGRYKVLVGQRAVGATTAAVADAKVDFLNFDWNGAAEASMSNLSMRFDTTENRS